MLFLHYRNGNLMFGKRLYFKLHFKRESFIYRLIEFYKNYSLNCINEKYKKIEKE